MKRLLLGIVIVLALSTSFTIYKGNLLKLGYDPQLVEISTVHYKNEQYNVIYMKRDGNRIKAKYFAASDFNGNNVYNRYKNWSTGKNTVLVSSGTYMDNNRTPVGLTIDNGVLVNKALTNDFDGLVVVYATGGIAVSNLKNADLTLSGGGIDASKKFDLRNSAWDMQTFINWAKSQEATVFQTHLLVYKNKLAIYGNSSTKSAERRFLAVGKDEDGKVVHVIVHCPAHATLYEGTKKTLDFLNNFKDMEVTFLINLDTGDQDVFKVYNKNGSVNNTIKGRLELEYAVNLLAYYYQ
ncbi:hypothetical protein [Rufibacter roseolus]|uniref:hypothetical protein n=1 Tax=Rufibacter roseolus TaxID=2817375 RepID=UPI001B314AEA|nr:hypothetical protein [Rufibacter roseolus]